MAKLIVAPVVFVAIAILCNTAPEVDAYKTSDCTSTSGPKVATTSKAVQALMDYCSKAFSSHTKRSLSDDDIDDLSDGCYANEISRYDGKIASHIATLIRAKGKRVKGYSDFQKAWASVNPCRGFMKRLNSSYMSFLRLAAKPAFYSATGMNHMLYVDMLATCDRISGTEAILQNAYSKM